MQTLRTAGGRAPLRLARESLRRLDRDELERVRGGDAARESGGEGGEDGLVVGIGIDQRSMVGCPLPLP
jgi:hypothetical protein